MDWEQEYADFVMQQEQEEREQREAEDTLDWYRRRLLEPITEAK